MALRTMLYTGKGGVGKTSVAAATARRTAAAGLRTLLVSTDPAHSLGDVLGMPIGPEPTTAGPSLWAQEIDAQHEMEARGVTRDWLADLLDGGRGRAAPEGLTVPPGLDELLRLLALGGHFASNAYDVLVVDCAATGETLRLLSFPDVARRSLRGGVGRSGEGRPERGEPGPGGDLLRDLVALDDVLTDHDHVSVRLVTTPERMVVQETRRTLTHLGLYGFLTDAVVVNRVLGQETGDFFAAARDRQAEQLAGMGAAFAPIPVLRAALRPDEVAGPAALDALAAELFAAHDPAAVLLRALPQEVVVTREGASLRLNLPFAAPQDVTLRQAGLELVVRVGGQRRTLALPPALADYRPRGAEVRDGALHVTFDRLAAVTPDA